MQTFWYLEFSRKMMYCEMRGSLVPSCGGIWKCSASVVYLHKLNSGVVLDAMPGQLHVTTHTPSQFHTAWGNHIGNHNHIRLPAILAILLWPVSSLSHFCPQYWMFFSASLIDFNSRLLCMKIPNDQQFLNYLPKLSINHATVKVTEITVVSHLVFDMNINWA